MEKCHNVHLPELVLSTIELSKNDASLCLKQNAGNSCREGEQDIRMTVSKVSLFRYNFIDVCNLSDKHYLSTCELFVNS